jgi:hypothetical protein
MLHGHDFYYTRYTIFTTQLAWYEVFYRTISKLVLKQDG